MVDGEVIKQSVLRRRFTAEQKLTIILELPPKTDLHLYTARQGG